MALGEIRPQDTLKVLGREFMVSVLLAVLLGVFAFARVLLFNRGGVLPGNATPVNLGIAVSVALGLQVITATLIGALLPLAAARMKFDPAVVASPALTTIVDITGLMIYFTMAKLLLGV